MSAALGSVFDPTTGIRRSARIEKLKNPETAYDATIDDAVGETVSGGSKRKGGSKTKEAIKDLIDQLNKKKDQAKDILDTAIAGSINALPYTAGTYIGVKAIQNVSVLGGIVSMLRDVLGIAVVSVTSGSTYRQIINAALQNLYDASILTKDVVVYLQNSPETALILASFIMVSRAIKSGKSVKEVIIGDANSVKDAVSSLMATSSSVIASQKEAYATAWAEESKRKAVDTLREIASRVARPEGNGAKAIAELAAQVGAPSAESGEPIDEESVATKLVPSRPGIYPSSALEPLTEIRKKRKMEEPSADVPSADEPPAKKAKTEGGRRRNTKKVKKVRRVTRRRRPIFSY